MIAESSRGTEASWTDGAAGCPAGVRARAERPNQLDHTTATGNGLEGSTVVRTQVWGQDLSGTMQGAGGVGGLLAVRHDGQTYVPLMDGNGNVMGLQGLGGAKDGQTVARYDYDAFGNRITNTAPELDEDVNPFGFSTKFTGEETGLVYYGYRYYAPEVGRWLNRDPIGERGGINLYGMVGNDAVNRTDYLGLLFGDCCERGKKRNPKVVKSYLSYTGKDSAEFDDTKKLAGYLGKIPGGGVSGAYYKNTAVPALQQGFDQLKNLNDALADAAGVYIWVIVDYEECKSCWLGLASCWKKGEPRYKHQCKKGGGGMGTYSPNEVGLYDIIMCEMEAEDAAIK